MKQKRETIFITGGLGFIGSYVSKLFVANGDRVVIYDLLKSYLSPLDTRYFNTYLRKRYQKLEGKIQLIEADIKDAKRLRECVWEIRPDRIVHLAALPLDDVANRFPEEGINVNVLGTINVLSALERVRGVKRFVYISSSMVYGDFLYTPCDEKHPTNPIGIYGGTKLSAEVMTRAYCNRLEIPFAIVRPSTVYGPTEINRRVTQLFLERAMRGEPLVLHGGGEIELDFTYVEDLAMGIYLAAKNDRVANEVFNITYGEGRSLKELVEILKTHFPQIKTITKKITDKAKKPKRGAMDISKARRLLGYRPKYPLEDGIGKYIDFLKKFHQRHHEE